MTAQRVAIVGGGIAGLICARTLAEHGHGVQVFDKGRAPGGRMATRRHGPVHCDHGAQFFTARDPLFARHVDCWQRAGVVAPWAARTAEIGEQGPTVMPLSAPRYVGVPTMSGLGVYLGAGLTIRPCCRVVAVERVRAGWCLIFADGTRENGFDAVLVTAPAPEAAPLLTAAAELAAAAEGASLAPCWTVMATFAAPLPVGFDAAHALGGTLTWAARDTSKPGRPAAETWVLHASAPWSAEHFEDAPEAVVAAVLPAFAAMAQTALPPPLRVQSHRWRHSLVTRAVGEPCLFDTDRRLGAAGDWCLGGRVEAAFLSGLALAHRLIEHDGTGRVTAVP